MRHRHLTLTAALLLALGVPGRGEPIEAVTTAQADLKLSFTVGGRVAERHARVGDKVEKGQVLLTLDDRVIQAQLELRRLRAENDVAIRAAEAQLEMDEIELKRVTGLHAKQVASELELLRAGATVKIRGLELEQARSNQALARKELDEYVASHAEYRLLAPQEGIIEKLEKEDGEEVSVGETIEAGRPVVRIVSVKTLRVDAPVPIHATLALKVGDAVAVRTNLQAHDRKVPGRITHIAKISDAASNTRLVRVEVPNEDEYLSAGWHVSVFLDENGTAQARSERPEAD